MKILLVEDNNNLALNVAQYLESKAYIVDYAADGKSAYNLLLTQTYDVILLDIMLPGMDGFSLCQKVRDEKSISTPIIMLTA
jgi:DNA-binding response OmpR family regulator